MLLDISKLLAVQIITTAALINIILLSSCCSTVKSLPITSKPIESTAENLAWEAWLMVPVGQQQKTRKVTPKSIFIVPPKTNQTATCPPGTHWSQDRCIPTVSIDTDKALLNQLSNLAPASIDMNYDYDYEDGLSPGAEKLEGSADTNPFSIGESVDEPLKFNIFRDTFPIGSSGSGDSSGSRDSEDDNIFFVSERRRRPPTPPEISLPDLDTDSSNYGPNANEDFKTSDEGSTLFLSGIDAILVPAVSENQEKDRNVNFSIYQETLNATIPSLNSTDSGKNLNLDDILKNESFFLDRSHGAREKTTTTTTITMTSTKSSDVKTANLQDWETTTMKLEEDEDVESKTEFTRSVTDFSPIEEETSQPMDSEKVSSEDVASTMVPNDTSLITERKEDITTITSPKEELTTVSSRKEEMSAITLPNEELTTITSTKEEIPISKQDITVSEVDITTTVLPREETTSSRDETTTVSAVNEDFSPIIPESNPLPNERAEPSDRFSYHQLKEGNTSPPVINIAEELRKINDLVARNSQLTTTTTQKPSVESISNPNDLLSKIIFSANTIRTSSEDPVPLSSTSTVWSSNSTSRNILSKISSSTVSSTEESQEFTSDPSSSTSPTPEIYEPDPYWWLPRGWGTERTEADRPLLLRFWSAISGISGSQTKV